MAGIIKASINLNAIPKDKIIQGKKGKYLPISITVNDEPDQFGNQGPVCVDQSKEEREAKTPKTYLGNVKVVWTNGTFPDRLPFDGNGTPKSNPQVEVEGDLPF
ncbi:MAG: hypothetical protein GY777_00135 [Candidatus Brocadiaceae bacterium]|jgi:hypothetical protein|nr:hypothetical protein [Candidatus Brocadiaceae bacterium]